MIKAVSEIFLASYTYFESSPIGDMLSAWEEAGVFAYVLPFLLLFAIINGILSQLKLFGDKSKGINAIISLVVSFMALQFPTVSEFFTEVFPRLGIGLAVLLVILILIGLFMPNETWMKITLFGVAVVILIVVLVNTSDALNWPVSQTIRENFSFFLGGLILIILFAVAANAGKESTTSPEVKLFKNIFGR